MWQSLRGRERLVVVFWLYCILGGGLVAVLPSVIAEPLYDLGLPMWVFILMALAQLAYFLWAHISLWTCAFNSPRRMWGYAARGYACMVAVVLVTFLVMPRPELELEVRKLSALIESALEASQA